MENKKNSRFPTLATTAFILALALAPNANAANIVWTGNTSTAWAIGSNWTGDLVPTSTDIAVFNGSTIQPTAAANTFIGGLLFDSSNTGAITITTGTGNSRLNVGSSGIQMNSGTGQVNLGAVATGSQGVSITANQNWKNDSASSLSVNRVSVDDASAAGTYTLTINGSGSGGTTFLSPVGDVNSAIDPTRFLALVINTTGGNTTLTSANTFSGGVTLTQGRLVLNDNGAAGNGILALNGGILATTGTRTYANAVTIGGDVTFGDVTPNNGKQTFSGTVNLGEGTRTLAAVTETTFNGIVSNGSITKVGSGAMILSGTAANTYTGLTTVSAGGLTLNKTAVDAIAGNVLVNGTGTLTLGAANQINNASDVEIAAGTFALGAFSDTVNNLKLTGGAITGSGTLTSTTAFDFQSSGNIAAVLAGAAGANKTTAGTVTFTGGNANTYTGLTTVSAGSLVLNRDNNIDSLAGDVLVNGTGTLAINKIDQIKNTANVEVATGGTLAISGNAETVNGVKLTGGTITGTTGVLTSITAYDFQSSANVTGSLAGTVGANKTTAGTVTFSGGNANTYTGLTTVSAGSLVLNRDNNIDSLAGDVLVNGTGTLAINKIDQIKNTANVEVATGGTLAISGNAETVNGVKLTGGAITGSGNASVLTSTTAFDFQSGSSTAVLTGTAGLTKTTGGTVSLGRASTYGGGTTLTDGTLQIASASTGSVGSITSSAIGTGTLTLNGGTLSSGSGTARTLLNAVTVGGNVILGDTANDGKLTFSADVDLVGSARTLTTASAINFDGVVSNGGINKAGASTLTLGGNTANTFTGATTVTDGTLKLDKSGGSALGSTESVAVLSRATLLISQSGQVNDIATVTLSGGTISLGSGVSETFGAFNITDASFLDFGIGTAGAMTFGTYQNNQAPTSMLTINNFTSGDLFTFNSTSFSEANINSYFAFSAGSDVYSVSNTGSTFTIAAIPEPSATVLIYFGLAGLLFLRLRHRSSAKNVIAGR